MTILQNGLFEASLLIKESYFLIPMVSTIATLMLLLNTKATENNFQQLLNEVKFPVLMLLIRSGPILILLSLIYPLIFLHVLSGFLNGDSAIMLFFLSSIFLAEKLPFLFTMLEKSDEWNNLQKIKLFFIILSSTSLLMFITHDICFSQFLLGSGLVYCMNLETDVNVPANTSARLTPLSSGVSEGGGGGGGGGGRSLSQGPTPEQALALNSMSLRLEGLAGAVGVMAGTSAGIGAATFLGSAVLSRLPGGKLMAARFFFRATGRVIPDLPTGALAAVDQILSPTGLVASGLAGAAAYSAIVSRKPGEEPAAVDLFRDMIQRNLDSGKALESAFVDEVLSVSMERTSRDGRQAVEDKVNEVFSSRRLETFEGYEGFPVQLISDSNKEVLNLFVARQSPDCWFVMLIDKRKAEIDDFSFPVEFIHLGVPGSKQLFKVSINGCGWRLNSMDDALLLVSKFLPQEDAQLLYLYGCVANDNYSHKQSAGFVGQQLDLKIFAKQIAATSDVMPRLDFIPGLLTFDGVTSLSTASNFTPTQAASIARLLKLSPEERLSLVSGAKDRQDMAAVKDYDVYHDVSQTISKAVSVENLVARSISPASRLRIEDDLAREKLKSSKTAAEKLLIAEGDFSLLSVEDLVR